MARSIGTSEDTLRFLRELEESPHRHDFFSALRQLEAIHSDKPLLGDGARPVDEPVRLGQEPSLAFASAAVTSFETGVEGQPHRLQSVFFGLFGPNGPLPLHLTEYARDRERQVGDRTFHAFADIFHHRMLLLLYRAWANAQPVVGMDRPAPKRIDAYVGSLFGMGTSDLRNRDHVDDYAKMHMAGRFALQTRPAQGLVAIVEEFLRLPVRILEFVGEWARLARHDWAELGVTGSACVLGRDAVLGRAVWICQHKFRLVCGPLRIDPFRSLLPGRDSLLRIRDLIRQYVGVSLDWDVQLVLEAADVPRLSLGKTGELGWTTWLGERQTPAPADDVIIRPNADPWSPAADAGPH